MISLSHKHFFLHRFLSPFASNPECHAGKKSAQKSSASQKSWYKIIVGGL
jgi:hypothetical protein